MPEFKRAYRVEFPDSSESYRNCQTLEDALWWGRSIYSRWRETNEFGNAGDYVHEDAHVAVITNRNTGYRWILRRDQSTIEFQTPEMFNEIVGDHTIDVHLTIEEAEALARAAKSPELKDKRTKALAEQALDQIAVLCRQVRERVRAGDTFIDGWTRALPRDWRREANVAQPTPDPEAPEPIATPPPEKEDLSLKDAAKILGKARNTTLRLVQGRQVPSGRRGHPSMAKRREANRHRSEVSPRGLAGRRADAGHSRRRLRNTQPSRAALGLFHHEEGRRKS